MAASRARRTRRVRPRRRREAPRGRTVRRRAGDRARRAAAARRSRLPRRPARLVLVDPAGIPTGWNVPREGVALAAALLTTTPRFLPLLTTDALRWGPLRLLRGALYAARTDLTIDLAEIDAPTLIVWGAR